MDEENTNEKLDKNKNTDNSITNGPKKQKIIPSYSKKNDDPIDKKEKTTNKKNGGQKLRLFC